MILVGSVLLLIAGLLGYPLLGWDPSPMGLVFLGIFVAVMPLVMMNYEMLARAIERILAGPPLACWTYTEDEWNRIPDIRMAVAGGSRREVIITQDGVIVGDTLRVAKPPWPHQKGSRLWVFEFSYLGTHLEGIPIEKVILHRDGRWCLEFRGQTGNPRFTAKIPVPPGEEATAERVLDFFTPRT